MTHIPCIRYRPVGFALVMMPQTRVLLFLKSKDKDPEAFEVTHYGYCFFWVQDPAKVGDLRRIAEKAVNLRRLWEKARGIRDERKRVEALWPYLWNHGMSFLRHTRKELQKTGAVAGEHIAERRPTALLQTDTNVGWHLGQEFDSPDFVCAV